jgi:hypothetical protein
MDRRILDLVNDFAQWKGDSFRLASLVSELQKEIDREKVSAFPEAVELI